jgi:hypothetical protein
MSKESYRGSRIIFATNHGKAVAALEPFSRILSAHVEPLTIDSDSLGTFTGEVERAGSMLDALRGKVQLARALTDSRFVLVSEGSFSSADGFGVVVQNLEMLLLHDSVTGVGIIEQYVSLETNYSTATLREEADLDPFLKRISFGSHALVLSPSGLPLAGNVCKGITERSHAQQIFAHHLALSPTRSVSASSDMRAHLNPTRMKAIAACCELLAKRLATPCPRCSCGGFGIVGTTPGLPCSECGLATQRAKAEKHSCPFCAHTVELPRSDGKSSASAAECEWCNP